MPNNYLNIVDIKKSLAFDPVYIMVDQIHMEEKNKYTGIKYVSANEPFFIGHFPNNPVLPGVLQIEAMFQTAVAAIKHQEINKKKFPLLSGVKRVKFRKPVIPGDQLTIIITISSQTDNQVTVDCSIASMEKITSEAQLEIKFVDSPFTHEQMQEINNELISIQTKPGIEELDLIDIQKIIPHRYPFLFIDKAYIENSKSDQIEKVSGLKNVTVNEPYTLSSYKHDSFIANSILIEIIAQVGCVGMLRTPKNKNKIIYFMSIDHALFFTPVTPANRLIIHVELKSIKGKFGKCIGKMFVSNTLAAEVQFKFAIMNPE